MTKDNTITKASNEAERPSFLVGAVMCSSVQEIIGMLNSGISIFPKGYLITLGEMKRAGFVECDLYKDGSCVVRLNCG